MSAHFESTLDPEDPILVPLFLADNASLDLTAKGEYDEAMTSCEKAVYIASNIEDVRSCRDNMFHIHHNMAQTYKMKVMLEKLCGYIFTKATRR